jgi:hypothetical protein
MRIVFPDEPPFFNGMQLRIEFVALAGGERLLCAVSAEALEDHFGAASALESELLRAFEAGKRRIHAHCKDALTTSSGGPVLLRSGSFRMSP